MKDVRGNEIKAGDMVHIFGDGFDYLCTVCRTRGRGIKFVTDDGRTLDTDELMERGAQFAIQGSQKQEKSARTQALDGVIGMDEMEMISFLRERGWYGTIYKKTMNQSTFRIEMPELEEKG